MARLSNSQGLLFVEISQEEVKQEGAPVSTLKGWFGAQQIGQSKAMITNMVNAHKGVVTHTVDDAILSSFPDARAAVDAAIAIQDKIAQAGKSDTVSIVRARMGVAFGPVRVVAGRVSGEAVTAAGMLLEKSRPGQILADKTVTDAVGAGAAYKFEPHGVADGITSFLIIGGSAPAAKPEAREASRPSPAAAPAAAAPAAAATAAAPATAAAAPVAAPAPIALSVVLKYAGVEQRFDPSVGIVALGRSNDNQVIVPLRYVSRKHAKIVWPDKATPHLINLSPNGSCVRPKGSNKESTVTDQTRLEGSGDIALCQTFGQISSPDEIVSYRLFEKK